jgi:hypothetical protein
LHWALEQARTRKDLEDPKGALPKEQRRRKQLAERVREYQKPRPMIEWVPDAFPREQVEEYRRVKDDEVEDRAHERSGAYSRTRWKKQGDQTALAMEGAMG